VIAGPARAATANSPSDGRASQVVFAQTNNTAGNQVVVYDRAADGTLSPAGIYSTGGLGGQTGGSVADHLSSQASLNYDPQHGLVFAVNAGSNTVSVLTVGGDRLRLRQVIGSGGTFPVSVAVHGNLVYILDAENGGAVQGYWLAFGRLFPIPGSNRPLGLDPTATPQFTHTPGQVAFSPDGSQLIVTTKANGNDIDVFGVRPDGSLSSNPVINSEPGTIPFGITFDQAGYLVVAETGPDALATAGHLRPQPGRDGHPDRCRADRAGRHVLGGARRRPGVRLQRRQRHPQRLLRQRHRAADAARPDRHRPGNH